MGMKYLFSAVLVWTFLYFPATAAGQSDATGSDQRMAQLVQPTTPLADILEVVKRKSGKTFFVDPRVPLELATGQFVARDFDYSTLLFVLGFHGLAATSAGDAVSIIPLASIRMYPLPVLYEDDDSIDGGEWVTRIVQLKNVPPAQVIPIMRPLLPQAGHIAAHPSSNTIVMVDRYANVKRVIGMINKIDSLTPPRSE